MHSFLSDVIPIRDTDVGGGKVEPAHKIDKTLGKVEMESRLRGFLKIENTS